MDALGGFQKYLVNFLISSEFEKVTVHIYNCKGLSVERYQICADDSSPPSKYLRYCTCNRSKFSHIHKSFRFGTS